MDIDMEEEGRVNPAYVRHRRVRREVDRILERRRHLDALRGRESDTDEDIENNENNENNESDDYQEEVANYQENNESTATESASGEEEAYEGGSELEVNSDENEPNANNNDNEELDDAAYLKDILQKWAADGGAASMNKLDILLRNLAVRFPNLPVSYKTLLRTPRRIDVTQLNEDRILWYKPIRETLGAMHILPYLQRYGEVQLDVNMDGLPLTKSARKKFWPILGLLVGCDNDQPPFVIALYLGDKDPDDVYAYLMDYTLEVDSLLRDGFTYLGVVYPFRIRNYILDAPARSLVKCCVQFNAHCSCEKCESVGRWIDDRMVYTDLNAASRTDLSYSDQVQAEHHEGRSPLEELGTGMVSQFRLDPLHLVYLGVFKRLLSVVWMKWHGNFRLHWTAVDAISDVLMSLQPSCPTDFNRKIRGLDKIKLFKGHEYRRMLHYDSILIFRDNIDENVYKHYLLLYVGLFILAHPVFVKSEEWREYAHTLLVTYVDHSVAIYGEQYVVYNTHALIHLVKECEEQNSTLDGFSAFKFESFLGRLKKMLKSFYRPCQQAACRISERLQFVQDVKLPNDGEVSLSMEYHNNNLPGRHFEKITFGKCSLQLNGRDQYFKTRNGDVVKLVDIVEPVGGDIQLVGNIFQQKSNFFEYPLPSSDLGIFCISNLDDEVHVFDVDSVVAKCWLMPDGEKFCCYPVLKFLLDDYDGQDALYDIGISIWLCDTPGETYWPHREDLVSKYIERKQKPDPLTWKRFRVQVKRIKATYEEAKIYLKGLINHGSNYETESTLGKGRRIKKAKKVESSDEERAPKRQVQSNKKPIPPPPIAPPKPKKMVRGTETVSAGALKRRTANITKHEHVTALSKKRLVSCLQEQKSRSSKTLPSVASAALDSPSISKHHISAENSGSSAKMLSKTSSSTLTLRSKIEKNISKEMSSQQLRDKTPLKSTEESHNADMHSEIMIHPEPGATFSRDHPVDEQSIGSKTLPSVASAAFDSPSISKHHISAENSGSSAKMLSKTSSSTLTLRSKIEKNISKEMSSQQLRDKTPLESTEESHNADMHSEIMIHPEPGATFSRDHPVDEQSISSNYLSSDEPIFTALSSSIFSQPDNLGPMERKKNFKSLGKMSSETLSSSNLNEGFHENSKNRRTDTPPDQAEDSDWEASPHSNHSSDSEAAHLSQVPLQWQKTRTSKSLSPAKTLSRSSISIPAGKPTENINKLNALSNNSRCLGGLSSKPSSSSVLREKLQESQIYHGQSGTDCEDDLVELDSCTDDNNNAADIANNSPIKEITHSKRKNAVKGSSESNNPSTSNSNWLERDILELKAEVSYLRGELQEANLNIARLLRFLMPHERKLKIPPNMPKLHLASNEEFDQMEEFLKNRVNFDAVVQYLGLLPLPSKEGSAAMSLMAKCLSNGLASAYNFDGHGWKLPFKETLMWTAIEGALSIHFEGSTLKDAITGVRSWLRNAPQREGGKTKSFFFK